jgi:DNA-binding NarL/FixJ family response regulator
VIVFDDHSLFREGLVALLRRDSGISVVDESDNSWGAVARVESADADIVLLDVEMPGAGVYTTVRAIKRSRPAAHIVILTMHQDATLESELLRAGASAYLTKSLPSSTLIARLRQLSVANFSDAKDTAAVVAHTTLTTGPLSTREKQVLRLLSNAHSNAEIARSLSISVGTVKRHTSNLYKKLGASSRMDAVRKAERFGIAQFGPSVPNDS